jgi:hypothetical protein
MQPVFIEISVAFKKYQTALTVPIKRDSFIQISISKGIAVPYTLRHRCRGYNKA